MGIFRKEKESRDFTIPASLYNTNSAYYGTTDASYWRELDVLENEAVYAAVKIIAESLAALPISMFKKTEKGPEKLKDHNLTKVLNDPNPYVSKFNFWETLVTHVALKGNGFAFVDRWPRSGYIRDLILLDPNLMEVIIEGGVKKYKNTATGKVFPGDQILHVMATSLDGYTGLSPMDLFKLQIAEGLGADEYVRRFFDRGTMSPNVIELPDNFNVTTKDRGPEDIKNRLTALKAAFAKTFGGLKNSHEPIIVDHGTKVEALKTDTNKDAQILELRKESVIKVARVYRIPPHMLMSLDKATFSNITQQSADFYKQCVLPWVERIESAIEAQLVSYSEPDVYVKFNVSSVLRGTDSERATFYQAMYNIGALSANEIRAMEELQAIDNKYANYHLFNKGYGFIEEPGQEGKPDEGE